MNAILPGNIETPMMDRLTGGNIQRAIDLESVGRLGKPEEIAVAVLWMLKVARRAVQLGSGDRWHLGADNVSYNATWAEYPPRRLLPERHSS